MRYPLPSQTDYRKAVEALLWPNMVPDLPPGLRDGGEVWTDAEMRQAVERLDCPRYGDLTLANAWLQVRERVNANDPPPPAVVAELMRRGPIPETIQGHERLYVYLADLIGGKVRRRTRRREPQPHHGRLPLVRLEVFMTRNGLRQRAVVPDLATLPPGEQEVAARVAWAYRVVRWQIAYRSTLYQHLRLREHQRKHGARSTPPPIGNTLERALDQVAGESGIPSGTLRRWLYP